MKTRHRGNAAHTDVWLAPERCEKWSKWTTNLVTFTIVTAEMTRNWMIRCQIWYSRKKGRKLWEVTAERIYFCALLTEQFCPGARTWLRRVLCLWNKTVPGSSSDSRTRQLFPRCWGSEKFQLNFSLRSRAPPWLNWCHYFQWVWRGFFFNVLNLKKHLFPGVRYSICRLFWLKSVNKCLSNIWLPCPSE